MVKAVSKYLLNIFGKTFQVLGWKLFIGTKAFLFFSLSWTRFWKQNFTFVWACLALCVVGYFRHNFWLINLEVLSKETSKVFSFLDVCFRLKFLPYPFLFFIFLLTSEQKISWLCYFEFKMYSCRDDVFGFEIIEIFVSFIIGFVGVQCLIYSTTIFNWSWVKSDEFIDVTIKAFERRETNLLIVCKNQEVIKLNLSARWIRFIFRLGTLLHMSLFPPVHLSVRLSRTISQEPYIIKS